MNEESQIAERSGRNNLAGDISDVFRRLAGRLLCQTLSAITHLTDLRPNNEELT